MSQKIKSMNIILILLVIVSGLAYSSIAAEPPCRQKVLSICDQNQEALVCKLLSYNKPETVESITEFLTEIRKLDSEIQQELICARLMGKKQIINLSTKLAASSNATFRDGIGIFRIKINDSNYIELVNAHEKLKKFKLCPSMDIEFDISGMVMDVVTEYDNEDDSLKSFIFTIDEAVLSNIKTIYAEGGFDVQRKPLQKRIDAEYQKYFNAGAKNAPAITDEGKNNEVPPVITQKDLKTYTNSIGMEFVLIPVRFEKEEDKFACGISKEVTKSFYIGKYEVTQSQWEAVMGNNPSDFKGSDLPVKTVSWDDIQIFIRKLNQKEGTYYKYRLPTEAEWEYAARAGSTTEYCFGDDENLLDQYAWYDKNSGKTTHPVGKLKPNAWGLYYMHGNVWEWCQDLYDSSSNRVLRGGSWHDFAGYSRSANRAGASPSNRHGNYGFRLVCPSGQ